MKSNISQYVIADGNLTALIANGNLNKNLRDVHKLLSKGVEQVGFVNTNKSLPRLTMMGGELCINASLALAKSLGGKGSLQINDHIVDYRNKDDKTEIELTLPFRRILKEASNYVLFADIGYWVSDRQTTVTKAMMRQLCNRFRLPAFGYVYYTSGRIVPTVYVKETDTLVQETACGSGSIAAYLCHNTRDNDLTLSVIQPTWQTINVQTVQTQDSRFAVSAKVERNK